MYDFVNVPLKGRVMVFPCSFLIPWGQNVEVMVRSHGRWKERWAEQNKEETWVLNTVRLSHQIWTCVPNNTCMRSKLPSHLGIIVLSLFLLSSHLFPYCSSIPSLHCSCRTCVLVNENVLGYTQLGGKSVTLGLQGWQWARDPDNSYCADIQLTQNGKLSKETLA